MVYPRHIFVPVQSQDLDFQRHICHVLFYVEWFEWVSKWLLFSANSTSFQIWQWDEDEVFMLSGEVANNKYVTVFGLTWPGSNQWSTTTLKVSMLTTVLPNQCGCHFRGWINVRKFEGRQIKDCLSQIWFILVQLFQKLRLSWSHHFESFSRIHIAQYLVFCVVFCEPLNFFYFKTTVHIFNSILTQKKTNYFYLPITSTGMATELTVPLSLQCWTILRMVKLNSFINVS